jgi:sugar lactone lactonase YvrE
MATAGKEPAAPRVVSAAPGTPVAVTDRADKAIPSVGRLDLVARLDGPQPTGIAVTRSGRMFLSFPRLGRPMSEFTAAELRDGRLVPIPDAAMNRLDDRAPADRQLISVQSVQVDPADRVWLLDSGAVNFGPTRRGGPKLVGYDPATGRVFKTIVFGHEAAPTNALLNDVQFDLNRGPEGTAYITDASDEGRNALLVVDLASGKTMRRLDGDRLVKAERNFKPDVEGRRLGMRTLPVGPSAPLTLGADGIALSPDGRTLYWRSLAGHHLHSVPTDVLSDPSADDKRIKAAVRDHGNLGYASDGLAAGPDGSLYLTDYENNAIHRRTPDGRDVIIAQDPALIWPDSMSISNGRLYVTANQLNRRGRFHGGRDQRDPPYLVLSVPLAGGTDARGVGL